MKESMDELKGEFKATLDYWNNIKSRKAKVFLTVLSLALIALKIFTTVLTFDWLKSLF